MIQEFTKAKHLIDSSTNILLTMHERMDGDDGGSVLAFYNHLQSAGKKVTCAIKKGVPPSLKFLPGSDQIADDIDRNDFDLLITFGCSNLNRTGSEKISNLKSENLDSRGAGSRSAGLKLVNIDHHPDNTLFGDVNIVNSKKSSVAELVYDFFNFHNWPITHAVATCLLTGIITDTGSFMHSNTEGTTLAAAADLLRKGAQTSRIASQTFHGKNSNVLKAWGKAFENVYYDQSHKIIYAVMTESDLHGLGDLPQSAFEGFVETLNTFPEAKFAMFLRQDGETIKGSLRTDPYKKTDVAAIAKIFGGGGHKMAAGFSLAGKLTKDNTGKWQVI